MPKGYSKSGINIGWFKKGHKLEFTEERNKKISEKLKGRKFSDEHKKNLSISKKTSKASQKAIAKLNASKKGIPLSEEHKIKIGKAGIGRIASAETCRKIGDIHRGKTLSRETREKMSQAKKGKPGKNVGERNGNWRGGVTPMKKGLHDTITYREWRKSVFERDDYTCQVCKNRGGHLEADHIKPLAVIIFEQGIVTKEEALACDDLWDINNGQTLCKKCHSKKTSNDMKRMRIGDLWNKDDPPPDLGVKVSDGLGIEDEVR